MASKGGTADLEDLRLCIDRVVPDEYNPARAAAARSVAESMRATGKPAKKGKEKGKEKELEEIDASVVLQPGSIALIALKMWETGMTLKCRFLDGDATQKKKVEAKAHLWEQHANIKLKFVASGDAEIRISFSADRGSWSAVGNDALVERFFPKFQPTMNFGWLKASTDDREYERVVVHEFGHALGCIHEHQNPKGKLQWNKAEVYRVFSGSPNFWTKQQIDFNILQRYSAEQINGSSFDPDSIMLYSFPSSLFLDRKGTKENTTLSKQDKAFIGTMYKF